MNKEIKIKCSDGFELAATIFKPTELKAAIMIAPATGIKRQFYHSFATFLSENGYGVITFDNRGIAGSKGESLNGVNASLINWGRLDMTAVLKELQSNFKNTSYHLVGHSAGGQLVGLMDNANEFKSMFNFGCSSGSIRNSKYPFKFRSIFFLKGVIPVSNLLFGHTKSHWFGMGEPLPKLVASQWSKWCSGKGYVEVDFGKDIQNHSYYDLKFPSLWLHASDDEIANLDNVHDMVRVFPKSEAKIVTIQLKDFGYKNIGHMTFFSSKKKDLWKYAIDWLEDQL